MTDCQPCLNYLQANRNRLLPHLGRHVVTTGQPPARLVARLTSKFHKLGHPTTPRPQPTEALTALRRLGKTKRLMEVSHGR